MPDDLPPPTPLPPAAQAPYPAHPAPHPPAREVDDAPAAAPSAPPAPAGGRGARGLLLIGGGLAAAALGIALALPLFRSPAPRKSPATAKRKGGKRKR